MTTPLTQRTTNNAILSRLSPADFGLLSPHLEAVDLPLKRSIEVRKRRIEHVYFFEAGFASMVANGGDKQSIEVGLIGREGMSGFSVLVGVGRARHDVYMQGPGHGWRMHARDLRKVDELSPTLHRSIMRYAHSFLMQTTQTALANGRSSVKERLARWLLMADDRVETDELPLTHEFLGLMLGLPRPGVTVAVQSLIKQGLISTKRGRITIKNRKALEQQTDGTYEPTV